MGEPYDRDPKESTRFGDILSGGYAGHHSGHHIQAPSEKVAETDNDRRNDGACFLPDRVCFTSHPPQSKRPIADPPAQRERFWVRLEKRQLTPPPLPDVAMRRLSQSAENMSLRTQVPLILHLEGENMDSTSRFVEQLEAQQLNDFEMDGLDALTPLTEEKRDNEAW